MPRASLVLLATLAAARGAPTSGTEHGLALLDELEADVHALDAQLGRSTGRDALGGLERGSKEEKMAAAKTAFAAFLRAFDSLKVAYKALTDDQKEGLSDWVEQHADSLPLASSTIEFYHFDLKWLTLTLLRTR